MRKRQKVSGGAILMIVLCLLTGCSTTELEERSFPMLLAVEFEDGKVTYKDAFPKEDEMGRLGAKEKDYNHLKVLVLEEDLLENESAYEATIFDLARAERFPRNTYVCVLDDIDDLFHLEKVISQDLGSYVEEYLKLHEEKKDRLLTLGDLIDEQANQTLIVYLPCLDIEENMLIWKGYMNTSGKIWQESN